MTVSIDTTAKKYHGKKAETYDEIRTKQERWDIENATVRQMLTKLKPKSVLDVPVGTGRFLPVYDRLNVKKVVGADVSSSMIDLAAKKMRRCKNRKAIRLVCCDIRSLDKGSAEVSVCVRFLDLIDEQAMHMVIKKLIKCSTRAIICTIRFGKTYVAKSNTAEHDEAKFRALLKKHGWKIAKSVPVFAQGWFILCLKPK